LATLAIGWETGFYYFNTILLINYKKECANKINNLIVTKKKKKLFDEK